MKKEERRRRSFEKFAARVNARDEKVVISRNGEFLIEDDAGRERERHKVPYGATLLVNDSKPIKVGEVMATWDPHTRPIISEYAGQVKFENVALEIWEYAELGYQEDQSSNLLAKSLQDEGFVINKGLGGIPTAFIAFSASFIILSVTDRNNPILFQ